MSHFDRLKAAPETINNPPPGMAWQRCPGRTAKGTQCQRERLAKVRPAWRCRWHPRPKRRRA